MEFVDSDCRDRCEFKIVVREERDRPRILAVSNTGVAKKFKNNEFVGRSEQDAKFVYETGIPEQGGEEFELAHYGLREPPLNLLGAAGASTDPESGTDRTQFYWLISLLLAGVALFLTGRYLLGPKRLPPDDNASPLPPPAAPS